VTRKFVGVFAFFVRRFNMFRMENRVLSSGSWSVGSEGTKKAVVGELGKSIGEIRYCRFN
jgi:hypothetical protein